MEARATVADTVRRWAGDPRDDRPLDAEQEEVILLRSIRNCSLLAGIADIAQAAALLLTGAFFLPAATGGFRPLWTIVTVGLALWCSYHSLRRCRLDRIDRRALRLLRCEAATWGVLHGVALWRAIPLADQSQQLWLVATIAGVIASGGVVLASERSVGLTWLAGHAVFVGGAFLSTGERTWQVVAVLLLLFIAALTAATVYLAADFVLRCRAEMAAEAERSVVRLLLDDFEDGARDWLWQVDDAGDLRSVSRQFARHAGRGVDQLEGRSLVAVLEDLGTRSHPTGTAAIDRLIAALGADGALRDLEVPVQPASELRWWSLSGRRSTSGPAAWRGVCADVTEERRAREEIERLVWVDPLTGLGNRRRLAVALQERSDAADGGAVVLAVIDLDDFKLVNDSSGHGIGDELLRRTADRLAAVDGADECLRLGGDEFAVVLSSDEDAHQLHGRLERYIAALRLPVDLAGTRFDVRGSCGYATLPGDATSLDDLLTFADLALYVAKGGGGDAVRRYETRMLEAANARSVAVHELATSVDAGEFEVWFQPQHDLASGTLISFEGLVRWRHPRRGRIGPSDFIGYAEDAGLIVPLGELVLDGALRFATSIPDHLQVAVNLSPVQLRSAGFVEEFRRRCTAARLPIERLEVEVTESAVVEPSARRALVQLRALGASIALDDFGTGYSSFATLRDLPIDTVKLDRSFITDLVDDPRHASQVTVRAVIEVAQALHLRTVAEGVETSEQATLLRSLGCERGQGYLWARPLPLPAAVDLAVTGQPGGRAGPSGSIHPPTSAARRSAWEGPIDPLG